MRYILLFLLALTLNGEPMYIELKSAPLKSSDSFLSTTIQSLTYGSEVDAIELQNGWYKVKSKGKIGWIHSSALSKNKIDLTKQITKAPTSVSSKEATMAAKGFSAEVEREYKAQNPTLRFDLVDKLEKQTINIQAQDKFVQSGGLNR